MKRMKSTIDMKKAIIIAIFIILVLTITPICIAQGEGEGETRTSETMTPADYDKLSPPTIDDFQKLDKPTPGQFYKLSQSDQLKYISGLKEADFSGSKANFNRNIADATFMDETNGVKTINKAKDSFAAYLKDKNVNLKGSIDGDIKGFSRTGVLEGSNGKININDFKQGGQLEKYEISIVKGEIILNNKDKADQKIAFKGDIKSDGSNNIALDKGSINGDEVTGGNHINIDSDGKITGTFKSYGGIVFAKDTALTMIPPNGQYHDNAPTLVLDNAEIKSIGDTFFYVKGSATMGKDFFQAKQGELGVQPGDSFTVNGIKVENADLKLVSKEFDFDRQKAYRLGDKGEGVSKVQAILQEYGYFEGTSYTPGVYDEATKAAVQKAQATHDLPADKQDGVFGKETLAALSPRMNPVYLDFGKKSIADSWFGSGEAKNAYQTPDSGGKVWFGDGIEATGYVKVSYSQTDLINTGAAAGKTDNMLQLPAKGYYGKGDSATEGQDYENIRQIQKMLIANKDLDAHYTNSKGETIASDDGSFGPGTEAALKKWQGEHGLPQTGRFDAATSQAYLSPAGPQGINEIYPDGGKITLANGAATMKVDMSGGAYAKVNGQDYTSDGIDVMKAASAASRDAKASDPSATVAARDDQGNQKASVQTNPRTPTGEVKRLSVGSRSYDLDTSQVYIFTAKQSEFTGAASPSAEQVQDLPEDLKQKVLEAGHMGIIYYDHTKNQWMLSENTWGTGTGGTMQKIGGVYDGSYAGSPTGKEGVIKDIYGIDGVDAEKVIEAAHEAKANKVGWFFTGVTVPYVGSAMSCSDYVCSVVNAGGVDLKDNAAYVPAKGGTTASLTNYVTRTGLFKSVPSVADYLNPAGGTGLKVGITGLDYLSWGASYVTGGPVEHFATPSQLVAGNLQKGTIYPVNPVGTNTKLAKK